MAVIDLGKILTEADIDSSLSGTSSNPVQNKVVKVALDGKVAEAPNDGKQYVRKNKAWEEFVNNSGGSIQPLTQSEYDALTSKGNSLYFIVSDGELMKIYYGSTLIAYKASDGNLSNVFPMVFPFVFG